MAEALEQACIERLARLCARATNQRGHVYLAVFEFALF